MKTFTYISLAIGALLSLASSSVDDGDFERLTASKFSYVVDLIGLTSDRQLDDMNASLARLEAAEEPIHLVLTSELLRPTARRYYPERRDLGALGVVVVQFDRPSSSSSGVELRLGYLAPRTTLLEGRNDPLIINHALQGAAYATGADAMDALAAAIEPLVDALLARDATRQIDLDDIELTYRYPVIGITAQLHQDIDVALSELGFALSRWDAVRDRYVRAEDAGKAISISEARDLVKMRRASEVADSSLRAAVREHAVRLSPVAATGELIFTNRTVYEKLYTSDASFDATLQAPQSPNYHFIAADYVRRGLQRGRLGARIQEIEAALPRWLDRGLLEYAGAAASTGANTSAAPYTYTLEQGAEVVVGLQTPDLLGFLKDATSVFVNGRFLPSATGAAGLRVRTYDLKYRHNDPSLKHWKYTLSLACALAEVELQAGAALPAFGYKSENGKTTARTVSDVVNNIENTAKGADGKILKGLKRIAPLDIGYASNVSGGGANMGTAKTWTYRGPEEFAGLQAVGMGGVNLSAGAGPLNVDTSGLSYLTLGAGRFSSTTFDMSGRGVSIGGGTGGSIARASASLKSAVGVCFGYDVRDFSFLDPNGIAGEPVKDPEIEQSVLKAAAVVRGNATATRDALSALAAVDGVVGVANEIQASFPDAIFSARVSAICTGAWSQNINPVEADPKTLSGQEAVTAEVCQNVKSAAIAYESSLAQNKEITFSEVEFKFHPDLQDYRKEAVRLFNSNALLGAKDTESAAVALVVSMKDDPAYK